MCKIFTITGIKEADSARAWSLLKAARPHLTQHDNDGFGYAALSAVDGTIKGERWLHPSDAFVGRRKAPKDLGDVLYSIDQYSGFGNRPKKGEWLTTITAHARMATCDVSLKNVHPFVRETESFGKITLVHNGVVSKSGMDLRGSDSCDSMGILNEYVAKDVHYDPMNLQEFIDRIDGYYACAVMGQDADGTVYVDIFRSSGAYLNLVRVEGVGLVWATKEGHVRAAAKQCGYRVTGSWEVAAGTLIRMDASTGTVMDKVAFKPYERPKVSSNWYSGNSHHWSAKRDLDFDSYEDWFKSRNATAPDTIVSNATSTIPMKSDKSSTPDNLVVPGPTSANDQIDAEIEAEEIRRINEMTDDEFREYMRQTEGFDPKETDADETLTPQALKAPISSTPATRALLDTASGLVEIADISMAAKGEE